MIHIQNKILAFLYIIIAVLVGTLISSLLYYFNITSDKVNKVMIYIVALISMMIGSIKFSKENNKKGLVNGLIFFIISFIFIFFISLIIIKTRFSFINIIYYLLLLLFSLIGGVIGKNMQEKKDI